LRCHLEMLSHPPIVGEASALPSDSPSELVPKYRNDPNTSGLVVTIVACARSGQMSSDDPNALQDAGAAKLAAQRATRICDATVKVMDALRGLSLFDCNLVCHEARERLAVEKPRSNRSPQASLVTAGEKTRARPL
jgi:hypothetical protein